MPTGKHIVTAEAITHFKTSLLVVQCNNKARKQLGRKGVSRVRHWQTWAQPQDDLFGSAQNILTLTYTNIANYHYIHKANHSERAKHVWVPLWS